LQEVNFIKPYFDLHIIEGVPGKLKWENGKIFYRGEYEVLLYHLIRLKKYYAPKKKLTNIPDCFSISSTRIYHKRNLKPL